MSVCDEVEDAKIFKEPRYVRLECARSLAVTTLLTPTQPSISQSCPAHKCGTLGPNLTGHPFTRPLFPPGRYCPDRFSLVRPCI